MDNREQVAALVTEGFSVYKEILQYRELALQAERDMVYADRRKKQLEARRDEIARELKKLGYHDVGHARGALEKNVDNPGA